MITLKQLNDHIKKTYPGFDIELVKGEGYFYFIGDDAFDVMPSIMIPQLNCKPTDDESRRAFHEAIEYSFRKADLHLTAEIRSLERIVTHMLEMSESDMNEHAENFAKNPQHFLEWNVVSSWADAIVRDELRVLNRVFRAASHATQREIIQASARVVLSFYVRRAERKIETSTYAAREAHSIAHQDAYARLCSIFSAFRDFVRDNEPEMYAEHIEHIDRAMTRGY